MGKPKGKKLLGSMGGKYKTGLREIGWRGKTSVHLIHYRAY
jgi:hypothetical protein